jgi:diguanylate cyclase (GGDEF)-like protein
MTAARFFEKRSQAFWVTLGFAFVILVGLIDYRTGFEINLDLIYLIPIFLATWFSGSQMGMVLSFASTMAWFIADYSAGLHYPNTSIYVWNVLLRLSFYFVVTVLVTTLKRAYRLNQELARKDYVTGAVSIRYFYELAQLEMSRSQRYRHPLSLVYIDLDNFKTINDLLGHSIGDKVLCAVVESIRSQVRPTDILARLGGDEFALLLPETDQLAAETVVTRLRSCLVEEMARNEWMLSFSIGVLVCNEIPKSVDEMLKMADDAMYSIKRTSKNGINYHIYAG